MPKGEEKEGKGKLLVFLILFLLLSVSFVAAADVAYIYKSKSKVDNNILDVFSYLGLSYDLIDERYLPSDFSKYKIIFVGDERFKKADKIPVDKKSSIIANYYFGEEWGLSDSDGVSKLASTSPLEVKKNNKIIPVYTQAEYSLGGISIPYYYLDKENKAPQMTRVAATYIGTPETGESSEFGDAISYAYPGTELLNNKKTKEKVCFFGIVESDYWTPAAREMFKQCVGFVSVACSSNSECGEEKTGEKYCEGNKVYQDITSFSCENPGTSSSGCAENTIKELVEVCEDSCIDGECIDIVCYTDADCDDSDSYTKDTCINPGKKNSYCQHYPLECLKDSDCGTDGYVGEKYCERDAVYQDYQDFECSSNKCSSLSEKRLIEECTDICREGECIERECTKDSDCEEDYYSENYCENNNVYHDLHDFSCEQETCTENIIKELVEGCEDICIEGECKTITCSLNSDCGKNHFLEGLYCSGGNVYQDFISFLCDNPKTINSYCSNYTKPILMNYCEGECVNGECITCFSDAGCGKDSFIGKRYCEGDNVYQDYQIFSCISAGTTESDCLSEVSPVLIEECSDLCINGECREIICYNNSNCNDFDLYTYDECNNPGSVNSYCTNTEINCVTDNDCGITGFTGKEFCYQNDIFKNYKDSDCINPGTKDSYCVVEQSQELLIDCGEDECGNWSYYCEGKDVWKRRECHDKGCLNGSCFSTIIEQEELVEECAYSCIDASCAGECAEDSDCQDGLFCNGQETCLNNKCLKRDAIDCSVFNMQEIATCNNTPDNNSLTWDYSKAFTSVCDESLDACTISSSELTHTCNVENCGAECTITEDCPEKCTKTSHKLYNFIGCKNCACEYSGYQCVVGKCGAECDEDSDCFCKQDYCNGTTLVNYTEYSSCGTAGSEGCLCQPCEAVLIENSTECGYIEHYCGDNNLDSGEECDDGNNNDGDGCSSVCEIEHECEIDSDCDNDYYSENYCLDNDAYKDLHAFSCLEYECVKNAIPEKVEDCGEDYCEEWEYYCQSEDVYRKRDCYDRGCEQGNCFNDSHTEETPVEECAYSCVDGVCKELICGNKIIEGGEECETDADCNDQNEYTTDSCNNCQCTHKDIACRKDSNCGENKWLEEKYCESGDVWDSWIKYECVNPGAADSYCKNSTTQESIEDCGEDSYSDWEYYCEEKDVHRLREEISKGCENGGCIGESFWRDEFLEYCEHGCEDGSCIGECVLDPDCQDDYYGKNYCKDNNIHHDLHDFSCINGECTEEIFPEKVEDCGESYCEE